MQDKTLKCVQCDADFDFSSGQQEFFAERGLSEPKCCSKDCREARKNARFSNREEQPVQEENQEAA